MFKISSLFPSLQHKEEKTIASVISGFTQIVQDLRDLSNQHHEKSVKATEVMTQAAEDHANATASRDQAIALANNINALLVLPSDKITA
jgi:hypothetical protein